MISKPSRLALSGIALVCAAALVACSSGGPTLQFVTVTPVSGEIYVSAASNGGVRGAARHSAAGRKPATLPPAATATCGSLQYTATALFSDGSSKDESSTATWSSSNTSVAVISTSGLASGIGLGTTNIGATVSGVAATSEPLAVDQLNSISVSPNPPHSRRVLLSSSPPSETSLSRPAARATATFPARSRGAAAIPKSRRSITPAMRPPSARVPPPFRPPVVMASL
jgi:hypothetical protein